MTIDWRDFSQFTLPEESTGYLLWQVMHGWQRHLEGELANLGITHLQFVLLAGIGWVTRSGELLTQVNLAEFCKIDVMQVSQVVRKLEAKQLVKRSPHPTDTRAKVLVLTSEGEVVLQKAVPLVESLDADFFGQCNKSNLQKELQKLYQRINLTQ
jgi:DNA-binding MarR family transcriptional regulator